MLTYTEWNHAFKLDPNKEISDEHLERICESGTDGIIVGGSDGVTLDNTLNLLSRVRRYPVACALEVSTIEAVTPGFDYYFIPSVMNSTDVKWMSGLHHQAVKEYGAIMNWEEVVMEGYCILNSDSEVAKLTGANAEIDAEDVIAYARIANHMYKFPVFYLEYSGKYGDPELVKAVQEVFDQGRLFYGGGITSVDEAKVMAAFADTIVVGNILYDDIEAALSTVKAVDKK